MALRDPSDIGRIGVIGHERELLVGIREFRANLHKYTAERDTPITITLHGEPIGYYIPVRPAPQEKDFEALKRAAQLITDMLKQSGVSEDEIIADFQQARRRAKQA